ncbi:MAG: hypothetical protein ACTSYR_02405, partial [Candidatus Odinarchaeia archaeon]
RPLSKRLVKFKRDFKYLSLTRFTPTLSDGVFLRGRDKNQGEKTAEQIRDDVKKFAEAHPLS